MKIRALSTIALTLSLAIAPSAFADTVTYATWNAYSGGATASGTETGTIGGIGVTYTGEIDFVNRSGVGNFNYFLPVGTYTSATVSNSPTDGGIIAISGNGVTTNTFTFSTPVTGLILSEVSLGGSTSTSYTFNDPFTILSCGGEATFGGGCIQETGNTMFAREGDGTIEFAGTISSLSWTTANGEFWNGFTIGLLPQTSTNPTGPGPVPEPGTLAMVGTGILSLLGAAKRKLR